MARLIDILWPEHHVFSVANPLVGGEWAHQHAFRVHVEHCLVAVADHLKYTEFANLLYYPFAHGYGERADMEMMAEHLERQPYKVARQYCGLAVDTMVSIVECGEKLVVLVIYKNEMFEVGSKSVDALAQQPAFFEVGFV